MPLAEQGKSTPKAPSPLVPPASQASAAKQAQGVDEEEEERTMEATRRLWEAAAGTDHVTSTQTSQALSMLLTRETERIMFLI